MSNQLYELSFTRLSIRKNCKLNHPLIYMMFTGMTKNLSNFLKVFLNSLSKAFQVVRLDTKFF